jgi:hypothetical protein
LNWLLGHVRYESPEQARQAFDALPQAATADTWGFMMKKVELPDGTDYVIVSTRRYACVAVSIESHYL